MEITLDLNKGYIIKGNMPDILKDEIPSLKEDGDNLYSCPLLPYSSFVLACFLNKYKDKITYTNEVAQYIKELANEAGFPVASMEQAGQVFFKIPIIPSYVNLMSNISARARRLNIYSMPASRLYEFYRILENWGHDFLPKIKLEPSFRDYLHSDITVSPDMSSLFTATINDLYSVQYGWKMNPENGMKRLKWPTLGDMILSRPRRYENRTNAENYNLALFGIPLLFKVEYIETVPTFNYKMTLYKVREVFSNREITCQQYGNISYILNTLKSGDIMYIQGTKINRNRISVNNVLTENEIRSLPIAPVYDASPSNGFSTRVITNMAKEVITRFKGDDLLNYINSDRTFWNCVKSLHFPKSKEDYQDAINKLAFFELVQLQLMFLEKKHSGILPLGVPKQPVKDGYFKEATDVLPFELTVGQKNGIKEAINKMTGKHPAEMLLSGDVGSGKSIVATLLAMFVVDNKQQVAIVGPTEILAKQLYNSVLSVVAKMKNRPRVTFISGSVSGAEQNRIKDDIKLGNIDIIVGTQTVFNIKYNNLGFVVIDEEQKFGAKQREKLKTEGRADGLVPDILSQTATPIPRSTALAFYGDTDLIQLMDKPAGRKEIITHWIKDNPADVIRDTNSELWKMISSEIQKKNQVFIICPAVEENDDVNFMSVKETQKVFDKVKKGLARSVHGKTTKKEQEEIMTAFSNKEFPILIGSSILEVGINIPEATLMIVLDADRFGASSLHQIRGRVGRSDKQSYCYLVSSGTSKGSERRLTSLVESNNGFDIAMADLDTRKEGDILGVRQSGESSLRFSNFVDHSQLIELAQVEAQRIFKSSMKVQALTDAQSFLVRKE